MNKNLHIDETAKQEVSKGKFPYQEAHWDALAARLPAETKELVLWPWVMGIIVVAGIGLGIWKPWKSSSPQYKVEAISQVFHSLYIGEVEKEHTINFIPLREKLSIPPVKVASSPQKMEKANPTKDLGTIDTVEVNIARIDVDSVEVTILDTTVSAYEPYRRPRSPCQLELPPWKKWGASVWAGPSIVYRNRVVVSSEPGISDIVALLDSVESSRQSKAFGIQIQRLVRKRLALSFGISWANMGYAFNQDSLTFSQPEPGDPYAAHYSFNFDNLHTELGLNYIVKRTRPTIYTKASISPSVMLNVRTETIIYYREWEPSESVTTYPREEFNSLNLFGSVGAGLVWPGQGRINLMIEPSFTYAFAPISQAEYWQTFLNGMQLRSGLVIKW